MCLQVLQVLSFTFSSQSNFCPHLRQYFVTSFPAKSCLQDGQRYIVVYPVLHSISGFFGGLSQPGFKWFHSSFASLVQGKSLLGPMARFALEEHLPIHCIPDSHVILTAFRAFFLHFPSPPVLQSAVISSYPIMHCCSSSIDTIGLNQTFVISITVFDYPLPFFSSFCRTRSYSRSRFRSLFLLSVRSAALR